MGSELALLNSHEEYSREKIELIKRTICVGATDDELSLFLYTAKRTGLDPLARQIHMVKRWNTQAKREVAAIQTGIDGYRLIADRTGKLAGISDPIYDDEKAEHPNKATVTVRKVVSGTIQEFTASARWSEFVQLKKADDKGNVSPVAMWVKMPFHMLAKCAEALALRKAFPADLGGVYTDEEMGQADNPEPIDQRPQVSNPTRASEKKVDNGLIRISGVVDSLREGKEGAVWVNIGDKLVVFSGKFVDDTIAINALVTVNAQIRHSDKVGEFYEVLAVLENPPVAQSESTPDPIQTLVDSGAVKKGSEVSAPKTIGLKRAQRLYIIAGQNVKKTGLTEDNIKLILSKLPSPLEHLRDLETGMYETFEKYATGEDDSWKEIIAEG